MLMVIIVENFIIQIGFTPMLNLYQYLLLFFTLTYMLQKLDNLSLKCFNSISAQATSQVW